MMQIIAEKQVNKLDIAEDMKKNLVKELIAVNFISETEWEVDLGPLQNSSFNLNRYLERAYEKYKGKEIPEPFVTTDNNLLESRKFLETRFGVKIVNLKEFLSKEANIDLGDENGEEETRRE